MNAGQGSTSDAPIIILFQPRKSTKIAEDKRPLVSYSNSAPKKQRSLAAVRLALRVSRPSEIMMRVGILHLGLLHREFMHPNTLPKPPDLQCHCFLLIGTALTSKASKDQLNLQLDPSANRATLLGCNDAIVHCMNLDVELLGINRNTTRGHNTLY